MMGRLERVQDLFFYSFCLDDIVPSDHQVRRINAVLDLSWLHAELEPYYSYVHRFWLDDTCLAATAAAGTNFIIDDRARGAPHERSWHRT